MSGDLRTWAKGVRPTPEQMADYLAAISREERIERAETILDAMDRADECFVRNHEALQVERDALAAKVARVEALADRFEQHARLASIDAATQRSRGAAARARTKTAAMDAWLTAQRDLRAALGRES